MSRFEKWRGGSGNENEWRGEGNEGWVEGGK